MLHRIPLFLTWLAFVVLISAGEATACSCAMPVASTAKMVKGAKRDSAVVFTGRVQSIVQNQGSAWVYVEFEVLNVWKGRLNQKVTLLTGGDDGNCGFKFKHGETYLVYVPNQKLYSPKALSTHICTRTALLATRKRTSSSMRSVIH